MNHQTFNKKSYGFLLYFTFQGLLTPLLSAFIPYYIELLSILLQNYNPVATKTDIGRRKDEEGRLNCRWNTICILPRKENDLNSDNSIIFTFETAISEKQEAHKQIKKLKLANKQADIQAFLLPLHSKPPFPKQRFRKIISKRNCKIIEIWSSLEDKTK